MKLSSLCLLAVALMVGAGCQSSSIGESETNKAFPKQSQEEVEAALAKEGKLEEYKAAQERDRAYQSQGSQSTGEQGSQAPATQAEPSPQ